MRDRSRHRRDYNTRTLGQLLSIREQDSRCTSLGCNGTAEDIASAILFLASDTASFINGDCISVSGDLFLRL
jgi:NAD(P)-dependent dehydrogenase (short-subunit alcohol dehydrogenase family)